MHFRSVREIKRAKLQTSSKRMDKAKIKTHMACFSGHSKSAANLMECGGKSRHQRSQNNEGHRKCQRPVYDIKAGACVDWPC